MNIQEVDALAKIIWDYLHMNDVLVKSDCILALGSMDTRVAERAADLYKQGYAPYILFSGGSGPLTKDIFSKPEAEMFAEIAMKLGVPENVILIENKSTNTGENIALSKKLLEGEKLNFNSFIFVGIPFVERRIYTTVKKDWPEKCFLVTSPQLSYIEYTQDETFKQLTVHGVVGELQRIKEYPKKGLQIAQEIPCDVWSAYEKLVSLGYTNHLIKD